ncbi:MULTISPECIES: GUN4 domain-containing protein [Cyanophyceae]|uniref:GUN4 domain-containing protein n=1 Tax=Cyanophyceae TaxID=3028117 RepID=UPI00232FE35F|nr:MULTISPECIES: GUN4 domain-containing protein [Cyanophyceae]MDB9356744.1 GUN4 domain-containing protein [Nodularia spumigena CS-587/03]MDB9340096.1 GUN4 domain-containing protein [Nodularia spumigena CS-589/07]MDB9399432.1 GUN4 domain-containing protein [Microcystis aeruginosa CS-567/02-A1]MDB9498780.1 GUN4 domain-containing protein [Nodularia spumigena CS-336/02]MDB9531519.1 GUN4 domain-containing protein [Nodularia spumigena CS-1038]
MAEVSLKLFFSYSHNDESLRDELAKHLTILERQGVISGWYDREIVPGQEWDDQIKHNLKTADIILLLVSSDFLASNYCWSVEVTKAIERHNAREACVIPVILRSVDWTDAPFAKLGALPKNAQPVKSWTDEDEAFTDVAKGIRAAVEKLKREREEALETDDLRSDKGVDYTRLRDLLKAGEWKKADQETEKVMVKAAKREKIGWLDSDSIKQFPCTDLRTIDQLWVKYSNGRFGFSVQKRIWESVGGNPEAKMGTWWKFADHVGWRKGFIMMKEWRDYDDLTFNVKAPQGHLPQLPYKFPFLKRLMDGYVTGTMFILSRRDL